MTDSVLTFAEAGPPYIYEHLLGEGVAESYALVKAQPWNHDCGITGAEPQEAVVGPSRIVEVSAATITGTIASPVPGVSVTAVLVDLVADACQRLVFLVPGEDPEFLTPFDSARADLWPDPSALLQVALSWVQAPDPEQDRVTYYSAEEAGQSGQLAC